MKVVWDAAAKNMKKAMELQAKYCNESHKIVVFRMGDLVLSNSINLRLKVVSGELRKRFIGPFRISERIGLQSYKLELPQDWKLHPVFHIRYQMFHESKYVQEARNFEAHEL